MSRYRIRFWKINIDLEFDPKVERAAIVAGCFVVLASTALIFLRPQVSTTVKSKGVEITATPKQTPNTPIEHADVKPLPKTQVAEAPASSDDIEISSTREKKRLPVVADLGFYYVMVRMQGDSGEDELVLFKKRCNPRSKNMPKLCRTMSHKDRIHNPIDMTRM